MSASDNARSSALGAGQSENVVDLEAYKTRQSANSAATVVNLLRPKPLKTNSVDVDRLLHEIRIRRAIYPEVSMSDPTREEINAMIAASEARNETKLTRVEGKIDTLTATITAAINANAAAHVSQFEALRDKISAADQYNRDSRFFVIGTVLTSAFAVAGLVVALATYGDALFGRGMNVRDVVQAAVKDLREAQQGSAPPTSQQPASPPPGTQGPTGKKS